MEPQPAAPPVTALLHLDEPRARVLLGNGSDDDRVDAKEMVRGLPCLDHVEQLCDVCVLTKQRRHSFPQQASFRAKERLELVHGDLCGPVTPVTDRKSTRLNSSH